jgi:hypothetical protein
LEQPFVVTVTDKGGAPLSGVTVWFDIDYCVPTSKRPECPDQKAYGTFSGQKTAATVVSDRTGRAVTPLFTTGQSTAEYTVHANVPPQSIPGAWINPKNGPVYFAVIQGQSNDARQAAGAYMDPQRSGEGWQLTFGTSNSKPTVNATWFTYDKGNQIWLSGAGEYAGFNDVTNVSLIQTSGANFGAAFKPADVKKTAWGSATFKWTDCNHMTAVYTRSDGATGTLNLVRFFYSDDETNCTQ